VSRHAEMTEAEPLNKQEIVAVDGLMNNLSKAVGDRTGSDRSDD
jgi:hypothetical protein